MDASSCARKTMAKAAAGDCDQPIRLTASRSHDMRSAPVLASLFAALVLSATGVPAAFAQTHAPTAVPTLKAAPARCRDAKGHFAKCPTAAASAKKTCRDPKGKFIACPT